MKKMFNTLEIKTKNLFYERTESEEILINKPVFYSRLRKCFCYEKFLISYGIVSQRDEFIEQPPYKQDIISSDYNMVIETTLPLEGLYNFGIYSKVFPNRDQSIPYFSVEDIDLTPVYRIFKSKKDSKTLYVKNGIKFLPDFFSMSPSKFVVYDFLSERYFEVTCKSNVLDLQDGIYERNTLISSEPPRTLPFYKIIDRVLFIEKNLGQEPCSYTIVKTNNEIIRNHILPEGVKWHSVCNDNEEFVLIYIGSYELMVFDLPSNLSLCLDSEVPLTLLF